MTNEQQLHPIYEGVLKAVEALMDLAPSEGSPEYTLLKELSAAAEAYEKALEKRDPK